MNKRFEKWVKPELEHNSLTKWNWMVQHPENLKLGHSTDIGAFCYLNAKNNIVIGNDTCIGSHSTIMPGIKIGNNVKIGAHSFVNKDIPDDAIAYGVPIKIKG